jgi:hypothetical protein
MENIKKTQTILDEFKENIPNNTYLSLCNSLQLAYEENQRLNILYELTYWMPIFNKDLNFGYTTLNYRLVTQIIEIDNEDTVKWLTEATKENISCLASPEITSELNKKIPPYVAYDVGECCGTFFKIDINANYIIQKIEKIF